MVLGVSEPNRRITKHCSLPDMNVVKSSVWQVSAYDDADIEPISNAWKRNLRIPFILNR
jgi:hypothetical protein